MAQPRSHPLPKPQWLLDLSAPVSSRLKAASIPDPPGFIAASPSSGKRASKHQPRPSPSTDETDSLKLKKSWEIALAPVKQLPMNAIMMYMSGNSLQIFSIMMVFMLFTNPIKGLLATNQAFARFETEGTRRSLYAVKAVYALMQILALGLGIWKVNAMGLLP
ncbi:MAG: hypothetical protein M1826_003264 [Phylliscum demangeonii]|nr:MAG: hypothetical protein M1826_003264 [Phylliscum demangeonii]